MRGHASRAVVSLTLRIVLALAVFTLCWRGPVDAYAADRVEAQLTRALVAYALARGLNGAISVAQGTEVAIEPAGIGVKLSPGQILEPINDLVERFSTVMLLASVSLGLQKLLLAISAWKPLSLALGLLALVWAVDPGAPGSSHARDRGEERAARLRAVVLRFARAALLVLIALRFAVPLTALASEGAYQLFLRPEYEQTSTALEQARSHIGTSAAGLGTSAPPGGGLLDRAGQLLDSARQVLDVQQRLEALERSAADVARNVVRLIAVFTLETVLFPLLFLGLLYLAARTAVRAVARAE